MTQLAGVKSYPKEVMMRDGTLVVLRTLEADDQDNLLALFRRIPAEERFYLKEDVTDPAVIKSWATHINWDRAIPIVATTGDRIIADATLHRSRCPAMRHSGELRVVVDPDYRDAGLGGRLIRELLDIASELGLTTATVALVAGWQEPAIQAAENVGFREAATLRGWLRDSEGNDDHLVIMSLSLKERRLWWF